MSAPFKKGSRVTWAKVILNPSWRLIWTPGPMKVISSRWDDGTPTPASMKFDPVKGIPRTPGWVVTVEYNADKCGYYDPPLSLLLELPKKMIQNEIHEKWLVPYKSK